MEKNTFWFKHDYNANNDYKILFLRQQLGIEGYGIYWYLIEKLADSGGFLPLKIIPVLSLQMQTNEAKVDAVIRMFELFEIDNENFFSLRLNKSIEKIINLKEINSIKGKLSAEKRKNNSKNNLIENQSIVKKNSTAVELRLNSGSTDKKREDKIRKEEIVENNDFKESNELEKPNNLESESTHHKFLLESNLFRKPEIPTFEDVLFAFKQSGGTNEMAKRFFEKYDGLGWYKGNSPIKNFRSFIPGYISAWEKNEKKGTTPYLSEIERKRAEYQKNYQERKNRGELD